MINIVALRKAFLSLLMGGILLSACSTQEADELLFSNGEQPLTLNSVVDNPATTRQTTSNSFDSSAEVAVSIGGVVKCYQADAGGVLTAKTGVDPFYWTSTSESKQIKAWYPYNNGTSISSFTVQSNQNSEINFNKSDLIYAPPTDRSYANRTSALTFYHQTCLVEIKVMFNSVIPSKTQIASVSVGEGNVALTGTYAAPTVSTQKVGTWTPNAASNGTITPFDIDDGGVTYAFYNVLLIPQDMTNKTFIVITLTNGKKLRYTPQGSEALLQGGKRYVYSLTPTYGSLEVSASGATAWGSETAADITSKEVISEYTADQLKMGDFFYRKADGTWATSDGGLRAFYSDGTVMRMNTKVDPSKGTLAGVVFLVGRSPAGDWGDPCYYYMKDGTTYLHGYNAINGYVMGINNYPDRVYWAGSGLGSTAINPPKTVTFDGFIGYDQLKEIKRTVNLGIYNLQTDFPAFYYATAWKEASVAAPTNSTGWFLPSTGQLKWIYQYRDKLLPFLKAATGNSSLGWDPWYWSSNESSQTDAIYFHFGNGGGVSSGKSTDTNYVMPCLVF